MLEILKLNLFQNIQKKIGIIKIKDTIDNNPEINPKKLIGRYSLNKIAIVFKILIPSE